ncbi:FAD/FMN-binding dehydrogenase [Metarhizium robertsii]|uniref:Delta(24)-sterol reductase n=1 Tax=Metarhizium robertsii TaxID=568076 RepID=A0A014P2C0_9HYPO|nr:FAD/FMN-binding dehydrogenase [Metarhizium robertsii]
MEAHDTAVRRIAAQVKTFHEAQKPFRIYHGSTNSTRTSHRRADNTIDTSGLNHVLSVDKTGMTALVEPNVPMDELVDATLAHGLVPPVVMEFPGITAGGGFSGTSGESSSFRYGAFDSTFDWIEIVLADGATARASRTDKADLFWGAASAFGTLGVVTLLAVRLRPAKRYVALRYELARGGAEAAVRRMREHCDAPANDFVDGVAFDAGTTLLCTGRLADELPAGEAPRRFTRPSDPWFYIRAREVRRLLEEQEDEDAVVVDHVPLVDYLFRWDRGGFWVGEYAFAYFRVPFNRVTRRLLDGFMRTRVMYRAVHGSGLADAYMVQDVGVPFARAAEFRAWLDGALGIYPLWLCPLRVVEANRALERKVAELGGKKWLYAHAYYTEEEFWAHYDRPAYDALRAKYAASHLPSVYDKVRVDVDAEEAARRRSRRARARGALGRVWPLRGLKGFWAAARGGDYLLKRTSRRKPDTGETERR